jgi:choline monooxygenase
MTVMPVPPAGDLRVALGQGPEMKGLSNRFYTDTAHFEFERDELFAKTWACVGFGSDVPAPGDLVPVSLLGIPLILLRDRQGRLKVFHNVCSHRGMTLVDRPARCDTVIRCPYHSWAYDLDGALKATPKFGGPDSNNLNGFDRSAHGLREVRSAVWFDTVFVDLSGRASSFDDHMRPLHGRWGMFDETLIRHSGKDSSLKLSVNCNWKLAVENYCESYHLPWVHPGLNSYSRLEDHYNIIQDGAFAGQGSRAYKPALTADGLELPSRDLLCQRGGAGGSLPRGARCQPTSLAPGLSGGCICRGGDAGGAAISGVRRRLVFAGHGCRHPLLSPVGGRPLRRRRSVRGELKSD